ncbi:MAG: heavy metal translocating P-type ATPase [Lachnospiraceae bacterium]|nr:heavy metal translocating P-type ATPase [Lachnospiraceae bacterium]
MSHEEHNHHEHHHEDECCCGHEHHEHEHHHEDECGCGHEHHEHEHHHEHNKAVFADTKTPVCIYIVENLDCANCAAKMERKINELPGVEAASITFATKQLRVAAKDQKALLPLMLEACRSIEPDVTLVPKEDIRKETKESEKKESRKDLLCIGIGALLFLLGKPVVAIHPILSLALYIIAYLILGLEIVITAVRNIFKGNVFDENFLMSIATLGAFIIKEPGGAYAAYAPEAVGVMLFYRIGEWFEHRAVAKSRSQIMDALDLRPETVNLVTGDTTEIIPAENAKPGDIVLVRPGDRIPLDGTVIDGESRLDTSPITGEPVPVSITLGSAILSGCMNLSGVIKVKVDKPLSESMVTRILNSVETAAASKPKIDKFITRFSRIYTPFVVALALFTAIVPSLITGNWEQWIYTALTFLVISCPCALVLSVPLAFFAGIGAGSKKGILFKGGVALEALKSVKTVVMDKTGTVTKGNFTLQKAIPAPSADISENDLIALAAACEAASTHPIALSICEAAVERNISVTQTGNITEISGHGILLEKNGSTILCGNTKLLTKYKVDYSAYIPSSYGTEVLLAKDGTFIGSLIIADVIKADAKNAVGSLKKMGLITAMLTGDAEESAKAVAAETGIDEVHARLLPEEKLSHLTEIREKHGTVMFVGDGINDAPVLAGADVGAAMGSGADAAIEAADVVFMTSDMEAVPAAIRIARITSRISTQNVVFAIAVKVIFMILGLMGISSMWLAVFADTGVAMLCILNSVRILYKK